MARILLTPKWLGLTVVGVVLIATFGWLGSWQWDRSKVEPVVDRGEPVASDPRLLVSVFAPDQPVPPDAVGAAVTVRGTYDADSQLLVPGRPVGGVGGSWVVTPLVLSDDTAIPVVRGWVPADPPAAEVDVPAGTVRVTGWLEAPESDALRPADPQSLRDDQIGIVSSAELLSRWPYGLYQGYLVLDRQEPASELTTVVPPQVQPPAAGIRWQNWGYAWQWWIFAAFVVFFWVRMLREDLKDVAASQAGERALEEVR